LTEANVEKFIVKKLKQKCWAVIDRDTGKERGKFDRPTDTAAEIAAKAMADRLNAEQK
jgi:hypothetical protein